MAKKPLTDEELQPKLDAWRKRWTNAVHGAKQENLATGKVKKDKLAKIVAEAEKAGITAQSFKKHMTLLDHIDAAKGVRADVVDEKSILQQLDRLVTLSPDALPLFDAATVREMKKNGKEALKALEEPEDEAPDTAPDDEDGKVSSLAEKRAEKEAAAS